MRVASKVHVCPKTFTMVGVAGKGTADMLPSFPGTEFDPAPPAFPLNGASRVEFVVEVDATSPNSIPKLLVYFYPITGLNWTDGVNYGPVAVGAKQRVLLPSVGADFIQVVAADLNGNIVATIDFVGANT